MRRSDKKMIQNIKLTKDQKIVEEIEEGKTNTTKELIALDDIEEMKYDQKNIIQITKKLKEDDKEI